MNCLTALLIACAQGSASAESLQSVPTVLTPPFGLGRIMNVVASAEGRMAIQYRSGSSATSGEFSSVAIFERTMEGEYRQVFETPTEADRDGEYGRAVALSDEWMAIGIRDLDGPLGNPAENTARVELFRRGSSGWSRHSTIPTPFPDRFDGFAALLALDGGDLVVSAVGTQTAGSPLAGAVHVYRWSNGSWVYRQVLLPDATLDPPVQFGSAVCVEDSVLLVESRFGNGFVYGREGPEADWILEDRIDDPALYRLAGGIIVSKGRPTDPKLRVYSRGPFGVWSTPPGFVPVDAPGFRNELEWNGRHLVLRAESTDAPAVVYEWDGQGLVTSRRLASEPFTNTFRIPGMLVDDRVAIVAWIRGATSIPTGQIVHLADPRGEFAGRVECTSSEANSIGIPSSLVFSGSTNPAENRATLCLGGLPPEAFGLILVSRTPGRTESPGVAYGSLCLGGSIGRFDRPGELFLSSPAGNAWRSIDLTDLPLPQGTSVSPLGETLYFQAWYRDSRNGAPSAHFTSSLTVDFAP